MPFIALFAIVGILALYWAGEIPNASVGGPMMIAVAYFAAAFSVAIYEAWTERRGVLGWLLNIVIAFIGAFFAAQAGGLVMVMILSPFAQGSSLAASGGPVMSVALVGGMIATLLGSWGALRFVKRWR